MRPRVGRVLWYVAYGSNLDRGRFGHYLTGGRPGGSARTMAGARDSSPPTAQRAVTVPGSVFFGWESPTWGGGVAFLDAHAPGQALGVAYRVTSEQFSDIAAQEMHREPGASLDLATVLADGRHRHGPGRYETLHLLGHLDGEPMLTFTADRDGPPPHNAPSPAYLQLMGRALMATHELTADDAASHLLARPGIGSWTREAVVALVVSDRSRSVGPVASA